jgi:hypothetical protein
MPTWDDFVDWAMRAASQATGRVSLRRRWSALRLLAEQVAAKLPEKEVIALLGKPFDQLDPEHNDLKALVAYAAGKGIVPNPQQLQEALREDAKADPLHFLAQHSGKTFGEKFSPMFAQFWLQAEGDTWEKKSSKELYDVGWCPKELGGTEIRIELKASSEAPSYLFQQIRHPRLSGSTGSGDYDLLLCLGVTAGSLEWWGVPAKHLDRFAENGTTPAGNAVITRHHGKRRPIWNAEHGFTDEGWFRADARSRQVLQAYECRSSSELRQKLLKVTK